MQIIDQLVRICHEIRLIETQFKMPMYCNFDNELTASAIEQRNAREDNLAITLYNTLKAYALNKVME